MNAIVIYRNNGICFLRFVVFVQEAWVEYRLSTPTDFANKTHHLHLGSFIKHRAI